MKMVVVAKLEILYDASKENQVNQMKENKQNKKTTIYFYNIELTTPVKLNFLFFLVVENNKFPSRKKSVRAEINVKEKSAEFICAN